MGIQINGNTNNINAGIGSLSIEDINELDIVGVATAANFKTGVSNLHSVGLTLSGGQIDVGSNIKIGTAGVVTATSFVGSGANLTSLPAQATIANNADNRVITGGSGVNLNGESLLTFNGNTLLVASNSYNILEMRADENNDGGNDDNILKFTHDGTFRAEMRYDQSSSTLELSTSDNRGDLVIDTSGKVSVGGTFEVGHHQPADGSSAAKAAKSALEIKKHYPQKTSGNYWIIDRNGTAREIYCEMETDGGGWMLWHDHNAPGSKTSMNIALGGSDASPSGNLARSYYNNYAYYTVWIKASQIDATGERLHSFVTLDGDGEIKYIADYGSDFLLENVGDEYQPNRNDYFASNTTGEYVSNTQMYQPQCGATGWETFSGGGNSAVFIREMDSRLTPGMHRSCHLVERIYGFDDNGDYEPFNWTTNLLIGEWRVLPFEGSLVVGPNPYELTPNLEDNWWWLGQDGDMRECYTDDIYTFGADGSFSIDFQEDTWIENWQSGDTRSNTEWQVYAIDSSGEIDWEKTVWTQSIGDFESNTQDGNGLFQQDLNEDTVVGINTNNLDVTENVGDSLLKGSSNNTLYIKDNKDTSDTSDDVTFSIKDEWGGNPTWDRTWQSNDGSAGKQSSVAAEAVTGGYKLLIKNEGTDSWGTWLNYEIIDIGTDGVVNWDNTTWVEDLTSYEKTFNQDFNNDDVIGVNLSGLTTASKEIAGGDLLKSSSDSKFYIYDASADEHVLIVEEWGGSVNFNYSNTWDTGSYTKEAVAAEDNTWTDIDGVSQTGWIVAIKEVNTFENGDSHIDWQLNYINSEGVIYNELRPRVGSIVDYETDFGAGSDLDGDGATGLDLSKLVTVTDKNGQVTDTNDNSGDDLLKTLGGSLYIVDGDDPSNPIVLVDKHGGTPDFDYTYTRGTQGTSNFVLEESSAYAVESYSNANGEKEFLLAVKNVETFGTTTKTFWETFQIEKNSSTNIWELDWNTGSYSLGIGNKESIFKQDMDGDGSTYDENNVTLTPVSTDLSTGGGLRAGLSTDTFGSLYITYGTDRLSIVDSNDSSVSFDWINYWGGQIHESKVYAVEGIDTGTDNKADKYKIAIKHTFTNDQSSQVDNYWQTYEIDTKGRVQWNTETFGAGAIQESDLGQDLDGDGITFSTATLDYQTIATDSVGVVPFLDNDKNLYIAATPESTKYAVLDFSGNQINIDSYYYSFGDYSVSQSVIAATEKSVSGTNKYQLLIESDETFEGTSSKSYQTINVDQSTYKIDWSSYSDYEDTKKLEKSFDIDLDNDGVIYTVNTNVTSAIDTDIAGAKLRQTDDGSLVIKDGETLIVLKYADGGYVDLNESEAWTGGSYQSEAVAVQKVGNNYKIAVRETITSGDKTDIIYQVVCADSTGVIDWGKSVWQTPEELIENIYGQDIDGDGVISTGTKSSLADTVSKTNIDGEVLAIFSNTAQSDFFSITNADTTSTDAVEMFVKGITGTAKTTYSMDVSVVQEANDAVISKIGRDTGYDSSKIKAITGILDFVVTIPDPDNYGKIVDFSWVLPEGTTNPKYFKKDQVTGEYFDFVYNTETREGALWDPSTNTMTVSVRDNGRYDSDPTLGIVRDPGGVGETSETDDSSSGYDGKDVAYSETPITTNTGKSYVKTVSTINLNGRDTSVCFYGGELATGSKVTIKELTTKAQNNAPTGVTLNSNVLDFTVNTTASDLSLTFGTDLVSDSISSSFKNNDARDTTAKWAYSSIDAAGNVSDLSYDPLKNAGAKFYDLVGNDGIAETVHLTLVDGGYGDKDGVVNGKIVDPSTAGVVTVNSSFSAVDQYGLKLYDSSNTTLEVNNVIKVSLDETTLTSTSDQIGYWVQNASDTTLTLAEIKTRAKTLFNTLESTDTTSITSSSELYDKEILLGNDQTAHFFQVSNGDITSVNALADLNLIQVATSDGTSAALTSSTGNISLTATQITSDQGLDDLIGQYQDVSPILDLESVPTNIGTIKASVEVAREANIDSTIGFYKVINTSGDVLDSVTGNVVSASAANYSSVALSSSNLVTELAGLRADDDTTSTTNVASIDDYSLLAPYAISGSETFFAFAGANSDGITHIKTLGNNIFGLEDIKGGGDLDYDDLVVRLDFNI